jgi:hypothetical protein
MTTAFPPGVKPHIVVATPCYGGMVSQRYMQCVFALLRSGEAMGVEVSLELLGYDSLVPRARNTLVATFLDNPTASHLLFVDADIGFETAHVARLLAFDKPVVAGMYPLKVIDWNPAAIGRAKAGEDLLTAPIRYVGAPCTGPERRTLQGFVTGLFAGTGFMMIQRGALERMIEAYPETAYSAAHSQARLSPNQYALFDTLIDPETREYLSEDYAFCRRWRAIGGEVWLDAESRLLHLGPHEFMGDAGVRYADILAETVAAKVSAAA